MHRGLSAGETLWHLRAGLNVAAISCRNATMDTAYNRMLATHRVALADALAADEERFRGRGANWRQLHDRHQTSLYNYFANPRGKVRLCSTATGLLKRINALSAEELKGFAASALAQLEAPFL